MTLISARIDMDFLYLDVYFNSGTRLVAELPLVNSVFLEIYTNQHQSPTNNDFFYEIYTLWKNILSNRDEKIFYI
jgi:hypothetical protein